MNIRLATVDDVAGLAQVYVESGRHHAAIDPLIHREPSEVEAVERIRAKLADAEATTFVAEEHGEIVGLLELRLDVPSTSGAILQMPPTAHVGISVRESRRNQGIGTALMQFAESWATNQGRSMMSLTTSSANAGAIRLYERLGYESYGLAMRKRIADKPPDK